MPKLPLILVPGLLCSADLWRDQISGLADLAEISVTMAQTRHESLAKIAADVLAKAPARFALAGLSMGGYVAFEVLRQAPERVDRLALLDTSARPDTPEQSQKRRDFMKLTTMGRFKGVTPQLLPLLIHSSRLQDKDLTDRIMRMAEEVGAEAYLRQQTAILARPDSRLGLARINCPTLVLCGEADQITPPNLAEEMAAGIARAKLELLPNCGHLASMELPAKVTEAMRNWLQA